MSASLSNGSALIDHHAGLARLVLDQVSMTYPDGTEVLRNVTLTVGAGEFVSIVGPSGCGKSTILKLASGLLWHSGGSISAPENLGYVFQDATLMPWRTVEGNIAYLAELHKINKKERARLVEQAIARVELTGFEKHYPRQLSGGMKMRASLARALTMTPAAFMFDEPFGALDEITRESLNDELLRIFTKEQFASIFVTHSVPEAVFLATRVLVMSARPGQIVADIAVPFAYPREPELRYTSKFNAICAQVSQRLRGQ